jgi:hypothetical protein
MFSEEGSGDSCCDIKLIRAGVESKEQNLWEKLPTTRLVIKNIFDIYKN